MTSLSFHSLITVNCIRWTKEEQQICYDWMSLTKYIETKALVKNKKQIDWKNGPKLEGRIPQDLKDAYVLILTYLCTFFIMNEILATGHGKKPTRKLKQIKLPRFKKLKWLQRSKIPPYHR